MYTNPYCVDGFLVSLYLYFVHSIVLGVAFQPAIQPELFSATFHLLWDKDRSKPQTWLPNTLNLTYSSGLTIYTNLMINLKGWMVGLRDYPSPNLTHGPPNAVLDEAGGLTFHDPKGLELTSEICGWIFDLMGQWGSLS